MKALKTLTAIAVVISQLFTFATPAFATVAGEMRKLLVTAYYSPLPDQDFYIKGSHRADVILNGRGTNGADGTEVFQGMLAAPKTYPFGTRVRIPGLGVGEVHDRGGAILARKGYDRIDVWMGHGEDGLSRALNWGARIVMGEVFWEAHQVEPGLNYMWVSPKLPDSLVARLTNSTVQDPAVFNKPITPTSNVADIKEVQKALTTLGYYSGPIDGKYSEVTEKAVLGFQLENNVIGSPSEFGAGNFGPLTRSSLKDKLAGFNLEVAKEQNRLGHNLSLLSVGLGKNSTGNAVISLQQMLWELGYYHGELTGTYDSKTIDAVFDFQTAYGVLASAYDSGAGFYGKQTHEALTLVVAERISRVGDFPHQIQTWVPAKKELPKIASLKAPEVKRERQALHFSMDLMNTKITQDDQNSPTFSHVIDLNDRGDIVATLQNILIREGVLEAGLNTGYYGSKTAAAVAAFQVKKGIIQSVTDTGAGRIGSKTLEVLNSI